ncbi:MAG: coenzyme F420-0:L-glutamate ligase [Bdellovibrionota bacterium]
MEPLVVYPVKTSIFRDGNLADFIIREVPKNLIQERMVLAVTSKIMSLAEGRLFPHGEIEKVDLVKKEADTFLGEIGYGCFLTIKEGLLIPSAGIDESNSETGHYILYPQDPFASTEKLWKSLREAWGLKNLGIVLTDSHTTPLRRGVSGISLAHWGFKALRRMVGSKDLFGRELLMTNMNLADGLATSAVMMMGEGAECCPLAIIKGFDLEFCETTDKDELRIPLAEDLYSPLLTKSLIK